MEVPLALVIRVVGACRQMAHHTLLAVAVTRAEFSASKVSNQPSQRRPPRRRLTPVVSLTGEQRRAICPSGSQLPPW
jgi:hypothetical protein